MEIPNLLNAAHDSPHEKIVRALSLSIAMFIYNKEESADTLIEQLLRYMYLYICVYIYITYIYIFIHILITLCIYI